MSHSVEQVDGRFARFMFSCFFLLSGGCSQGFYSYLLGRDELQRSESSLEVGSAGLEVVEGTSDAGLELRGVLAGGRVRRDLVERGGRHFDCGLTIRLPWRNWQSSMSAWMVGIEVG